DRHAGREGLENRSWKTVGVGTVEIDVSLVIQLAHPRGRHSSEERDVLQPEIDDELANVALACAVASDDEPSLGNRLLYQREGPQRAFMIVDRLEETVEQKDRTRRWSLLVRERLEAQVARYG